jgi:hypothetical protein
MLALSSLIDDVLQAVVLPTLLRFLISVLFSSSVSAGGPRFRDVLFKIK